MQFVVFQGNALREAGRPDEAVACYTACIQLQLQRPAVAASVRPAQVHHRMSL